MRWAILSTSFIRIARPIHFVFFCVDMTFNWFQMQSSTDTQQALPEPSSRVSSPLICHQQMSSPDYPLTRFYSSFTPQQLLVGRGHLLVVIPCLRPVSTWMLTSQQMILRRMTTTNLFVVILMFRTSKFQMNKDWDILLLHFLFSNYWSGSVKECWWCWVPHLFCGN